MFAAVRAAHLAAVILLFGGFAYLVAVAVPGYGDAGAAASRLRQRLLRRVLAVAVASLIVALASGAAWLVVQAAEMSGQPFLDAFAPDLLRTVLGATRFGDVWKLRLVIFFALGLVVVVMWLRAPRSSEQLLGVVGLILAALLLGSIAWAGHAAAASGAEYAVMVIADSTHLLAAAAWLGALPWLVFTLRQSRAHSLPSLAAAAARRFSALGLASVICIVASGLVNGWHLVGSVPGLLGTPYGQLLMLKVALLLAMLCLAAINRTRWTPRLALAGQAADMSIAGDARSRLARNAVIETVLGIAIVMVAGALGATPPAAHEQPDWPLPFALIWPQWNDVGPLDRTILVAGLFAAVTLYHVARLHGVGKAHGGLIGMLVAGLAVGWVLARPAFPTSFRASPEPFNVTSIARGASIYDVQCARCHGPDGYGDGDDAIRMRLKPPDLTRHALFHREGDLHWWVSHGIAGSAMPGFQQSTDETGRWQVINYVLAMAEAEGANKLTGSVLPRIPVSAPEFTFQFAGGGQQALSESRGRNHVLLVLFSYPDSIARLCAIADARGGLLRARVRVLAVPMNAERSDAIDDAERRRCIDPLVVSGADADIVATYTMFRRVWSALDVPPAPAHAEFLVDIEGYLRARWLAPRSTAATGPDAIELLREIDILDREPPHPPVTRRHAH